MLGRIIDTGSPFSHHSLPLHLCLIQWKWIVNAAPFVFQGKEEVIYIWNDNLCQFICIQAGPCWWKRGKSIFYASITILHFCWNVSFCDLIIGLCYKLQILIPFILIKVNIRMNWMNVDEISILLISLSKVILKVKQKRSKKETAQTFQSVTHRNDSAFQALGILCPFYVWDCICASNIEAEADTAVSLIILFVFNAFNHYLYTQSFGRWVVMWI